MEFCFGTESPLISNICKNLVLIQSKECYCECVSCIFFLNFVSMGIS